MTTIAKAALIAALFIGGSVLAAGFTQPTQSPPNGNVEVPINASAAAQAKAGNFAAAALYGAWVQGGSGLCIGSDCRTAWPEGGNSSTVPSVCQLERIAVLYPGQYAGPNQDSYRARCDENLHQDQRTQGWVATGSDACAEDRSDCTTDGVSCYYTRLTCEGVPVPSVANVYTPNEAVNIRFYKAPPTNSGGGGGGGGDVPIEVLQ